MKRLVAAVALAVAPACAYAIEHEIRVHTDQIVDPGKRTVELHTNVGRPGKDDEDREHRVVRVMPQLNYGFMRHWQVGIHLPLSHIAGNVQWNGLRSELKYVAPHDKERGPYWGALGELMYSRELPEKGLWSTELTPIVGWRLGKWHVAFNPRFDLRLSGEGRELEFSPAAMVLFKLAERHEIGVEHHAELGPLKNFRATEQQKHVLFAAWHYKIGDSLNANVGIGRGLTDASESWVARMLLEVKLK